MSDLSRMNKDQLEAYALERFGVDLHKGLSKENMLKEIEAMASAKSPKKPAVKTPAGASDKRWGDLTEEQQETLVQICGKAVRRGASLDPDGRPAPGLLARMCGHEYGTFPMVTDDQRDAAYEEAYSRSPALDHVTIVSKRRWPK